MNKITISVLFPLALLLSSPGYSESDVDAVTISKVSIVKKLVMITLKGDLPENQENCIVMGAKRKVVIDLDNNDNAGYLYTHIMTAMVSNKPVNLLLNGCVSVSDIMSLPSVDSVEIIN